MQSRLGEHPVATAHAVCSDVTACRVCSWSGAEGRFRAIAAGKMPLLVRMFAAFAAGVPQKADFVQSRQGEHPVATAHAVCSDVTACRVCSWSAVEGRFHAIAARRTPRRNCSRCMLRCDSLPRLQLECRRRAISCNRGRRNAPSRLLTLYAPM